MQIVTYPECIFYIKELISPALCRAIIENYIQDPRKHDGYTVGSRGERKSRDEVKVSIDLGVDNSGVWSGIHEELHAAVSRAVAAVAAQFPSLQVWPLRSTGYKVQHYRCNEGHFKWHFDALGPGAWERQLALIIYLNSVESGGETCFHRQDLRIKPMAGDALFFPTFWTHMHCGEVPRSEDKYVISSFICFAIPASVTEGVPGGAAGASSGP
jgi:2OG-Fe(II) oxygenase superfamily